MDWNGIGIGALAGGLAGAIGTAISFAIIKDRNKAAILSIVLVAVLYSVFSKIANDYLVTPPDPDQLFAEISQEIALIRRIESADPALHEEIRSQFAAELERGVPPNEAGYGVGKRAADYAVTRLPRADDQTVIAFLTVTNDALEALADKDPELCFRYLFPHIDGGIETDKHLSAELNDRQMAVLAEMIDTYDEGREMPTAEDFEALFTPIAQRLVQDYGQAAVAAMATPAAADTDRAQICLIARDMYGGIEELPQADAVIVLRALLAQ